MKLVRENVKKLGYMPIGYKLMLSYMIFIVILVSVNYYVSHSMYDASMRNQTRMNIQGTLKQMRDNVAYKYDDMVRISNTLYGDYNLVESIRLKEEGINKFNRMTQLIIPKLEIASKSIGMNLRLSVYFHNQTVNERYRNWTEEDNHDSTEQTYDIYHMSRILDKEWYKTIPEEDYSLTMQWKQVEEDARDGRISLVRRIVDMNNPLQVEELGIMRFSVRMSELFNSIDYGKLGEGSILTVMDSTGKIIFASGKNSEEPGTQQSALYKYASSSGSSKQEYLRIEEKMTPQKWTIVAQVPLTIIVQEAERVRTYIIGICVLCFVLFTFAGIFISRYFSKRITKFVSVLNAFRDGDLHKRMAYKGKDEFSQIATALNGMGEDVEALINKVYLTQLQKKEAELEMLQLQINPHFLYNTLSSINQLAKFGENEKLQKMVMELAKFYRLTLNSGRTMIPIAAELEQANAYLGLQKVKYGHRLEATFDIDASIWPYETVKLILQPFIENTLKHAWSGDRIHVRIAAYLEGKTIHYFIIDDGLGMTMERIDDIRSGQDKGNIGCGIRNIDQRIKLHYGTEYGVAIHSRIGIGTSIHIRIPARKRKLFAVDGDSNVEGE
jgi:two-component system sensor histidine kinase YesM